MAPQHVTMPDALIHLRVPASLKARWVRMSRAKGQRLTDWLIERVERGDPDPVAESISAEVMAEERAGQRISHHPGSA